MGNRYNKLEIKMPMEFGYIFNQLCRVGYKRTLSQCSNNVFRISKQPKITRNIQA